VRLVSACDVILRLTLGVVATTAVVVSRGVARGVASGAVSGAVVGLRVGLHVAPRVALHAVPHDCVVEGLCCCVYFETHGRSFLWFAGRRRRTDNMCELRCAAVARSS
jgi:hypothetical protein